MMSYRSRGGPTSTGEELITSPSFHSAWTVTPASFTTLNVRNRRPDTASPRIHLMILVASFWAQVFRVRLTQAAPPDPNFKVGSAVISALVRSAVFVLLQWITAWPPR